MELKPNNQMKIIKYIPRDQYNAIPTKEVSMKNQYFCNGINNKSKTNIKELGGELYSTVSEHLNN